MTDLERFRNHCRKMAATATDRTAVKLWILLADEADNYLTRDPDEPEPAPVEPDTEDEPLFGDRTPRLAECVKTWPGCETGEYDPRCCRFPKSCSCTIYDEKYLKPGDLETMT